MKRRSTTQFVRNVPPLTKKEQKKPRCCINDVSFYNKDKFVDVTIFFFKGT